MPMPTNPALKTVPCRFTGRLVVLILALSLPLAVNASAQSDVFGEAVSVIEVEVPVQVWRDGEPLRGLTAEDFAVYDRGERQAIHSFEVVDLAVEEEIEARPGRRGRNVRLGPPAPAERYLLLLFDFTFSGRFDLLRAVSGAREMVGAQLHPADRVAVATYGGTVGVTFLCGFTTDRRELELALDVVLATLDRRPEAYLGTLAALLDHQGGGQDLERLAEDLGWAAGLAMAGGALPELDGSVRGSGGGRFVDTDLADAGELETGSPFAEASPRPPEDLLARLVATNPFDLGLAAEDAQSVSVLRDLGKSLGELSILLRDVGSGVRRVLFFSRGFGGDFLSAFGPQTTSALRALRPVRQGFLRSGWTLDTIDLSGIGGSSVGGSSALFYLANETGGEVYAGENRFSHATARLLSRTSLTYVLRFHPSKLEANGRFHRLEVKLAGDDWRGTRIEHRPGYYAPRPERKRSPLERRLDAAELLFGEAEAFEIAVVPRVVPVGADQRVPVVLEINGESLLGEQGDEGATSVEIQGYALDAAGGVGDFFVQRIQLDLAEVGDWVRRGGLRFEADLDLPPGDYRLRLLVQGADGRYFLGTMPVSVKDGRVPPATLPPAGTGEDRPLVIREWSRQNA